MRLESSIRFALAAAVVCASSFAQAQEEPKEGPCKEIVEACTKAGFAKGEAKDGKGLWADCVGPLVKGEPNKKATLPLPTVDAAVISACKEKRPGFGEHKGGGKHKKK